MTKTENKAAIRSLPALRASLIWFKRETVRELRQRAEGAPSTRLREAYHDRACKVARAELADLRASYEACRVTEIRNARRFELSRAVPSIVWMTT